jgi:HlyD family secretion protein
MVNARWQKALDRLQATAQRKWLLVGAAVVVIVVAGLVAWRALRPAAPANVIEVRRGRITANVEASGTVRAAREAWLSLRTGGIVKTVAVKPGQLVNSGDLLVQADTADAERQVREAELAMQIRQIEYDNLRGAPSGSQIEIARANLRRAAAILQAAQSAYDRVTAQGKAAGSNEAAALESAKLDFETARAQFDTAVAGPSSDQLQIASKNLELARSSLQAARDRLDGSALSAPFAGTVLAVNINEGETAYGEKIVRLADLATLEVAAQVDELDIGELQVGQEVQVQLEAIPGQVLTGHVARITPSATPARGSVSYEVAITFAPGPTPVRPDMTANLKIITLTHDDTLLVPSRAVEARGRNKYVRVVSGGRPRDVKVTTGLSDGSDTEILDGLQEGMNVVVR